MGKIPGGRTIAEKMESGKGESRPLFRGLMFEAGEGRSAITADLEDLIEKRDLEDIINAGTQAAERELTPLIPESLISFNEQRQAGAIDVADIA